MSETLLNSVGQSLIAIGLYTVAFESMVLTFRGQMHGYLSKNEPSSLPAFKTACKTADKTLKFCESKVISIGILAQVEIDALVAIRKRRNSMAHEGYNQMLTLTVKDVEDDVAAMFGISRKLEQWGQLDVRENPDGSIPFRISPSIFGMYLSGVKELAITKLSVEAGASSND